MKNERLEKSLALNEWGYDEPIPGRFTEPPQPLRLGPKRSVVVDPYEIGA